MLRRWTLERLMAMILLSVVACHGKPVGAPPERGSAGEASGGEAGSPSAETGAEGGARDTSGGQGGTASTSEGQAGVAGTWPTGGARAAGGSDMATATAGAPPRGGAGGKAPLGGAGNVPAGGTGGVAVTGATGGIGATGPTGGAAVTGATGGTAAEGGAGGACTTGATLGTCAEGRLVCDGGQWVSDRACFASACSMVDCGAGSSACCEGFGRVAVAAFDYVPDESMVLDFVELAEPVGVSASFTFDTYADIGAISLYLSEPVPWGTIADVMVVMGFTGNYEPLVPDISLELQGSNQGGVWWLEESSPGEWWTPVDLYNSASGGCFPTAGCPLQVDLINIRLRPWYLNAPEIWEATLEIYGIYIVFSS